MRGQLIWRIPKGDDLWRMGLGTARVPNGNGCAAERRRRAAAKNYGDTPTLSPERGGEGGAGGGQSSSGIIKVMAGCGSSMSSAPQVAMSLTSRAARLSLRT